VGIILALTFIGCPSFVRTLQPVIEDLEREVEEAAASLGASPMQIFTRVVLPALLPATLTGFSLAFARRHRRIRLCHFHRRQHAMKTEIAPLLIVTQLEQYDYAGGHGDRGHHVGAFVLDHVRHQRTASWTSSRYGGR